MGPHVPRHPRLWVPPSSGCHTRNVRPLTKSIPSLVSWSWQSWAVMERVQGSERRGGRGRVGASDDDRVEVTQQAPQGRQNHRAALTTQGTQGTPEPDGASGQPV